LTFPGAQILAFDGDAVRPVSLEETTHFQITKGILHNPGVYWKHLRASADADELPADEVPREPKARSRAGRRR
jgi:hypothetical protein